MNRPACAHPNVARRQGGAALITSLVFLVILTMLALNGATTTNLETRMAGSISDLNVAFQAAETALRDGEAWVESRNSRPWPESAGSGCTAPCDIWELDALGSFPDAGNKDHAWWQTNARAFSAALGTVATQPRYVVEEIRFSPDSLNVGIGVPPGQYFYRLSARGTGGEDAAQALVQSTYVRRY